MTEPRDEIDDWLRGEVDPLVPSPGTFERIHRRARRHKMHQAVAAGAGAVVVIAAAALVPTLGGGLLTGSRHHPAPAAASGLVPPASPAPGKRASSSARPSIAASSTAPLITGTGLSLTTSGTRPPAHFRPTSITMIGDTVGAVIGQAGPPCATQYCTSLAGTSRYGASWYGVSAPRTGGAGDLAGVSQVRFLNLDDGWAFGPALQETSDGGRHWSAVATYGLRVADLEAAGNRAFVVLASCQGSGAAYASDCSTFSLYWLAAGRTTLRRVRTVIPASAGAGAAGTAGRASSASLVIAGNGIAGQGTGYLITPSGDLLSGSVSGGAWSYAGKAPCAPGAAASDGSPLGAQLTVGNGKLLIDCAASTSGTSGQSKRLWESANGSSWTSVSRPPAAGLARSLASASPGQAVLATTTGIDYAPEGRTWRQAVISGGSPAGGFSYVGMTTATLGVAVPAQASLGEVFVTRDGGLTWAPSPITG